ncbi:MAG: extracellular solute-binding protein family 1 [Rubrobacteraceae bacterium]|jgi:multiple sugar transport system substrate-binding protein|nr:extracellular solute-binding protein family 1 [Rubrobacteraceae bacterium]
MKRTRIGGRRGAELSRKDFLRLGGAGLAGAALLGAAGCGGGGESSSGEVIFSWGPDDTGVLPKLIQKFNEQHKGEFQVRYREMPSDTGQYFDQLRTEFQAGGGDTDVIGGDVIWPAQFAASGWISDLSDRFTDTDAFLPGPMQAMTYDGKVWGVPWYTDSGLLYYRRDLLEQAGFSGPPATWEELKEMGLQTKQDTGTQLGFAFQGAEYEGGVCNGLEYIRTHGGEVLDPNDPSKVIIDSPESAAGLETWHSMIEDGVTTQAVLQYKEDESYGAFIRGDAIFLRNWPYVYALLSNPEESEITPDQVGVAPIPVSEGNQSYSTLGGWNFLINAASDVQDEAWEFVRWMTDPEQLKTNAIEGSRLPVRRSLYEDQEVLEKVPVARLGKEAIIDNATPRPVSPYYSDISLELAEQFNAALAGDVSPEQAVKTLQSDLQSIVEEGQAAG